MPLTRDEDIRELLTNARNIAVVGLSDRPDRPSYGVAAMLQRHGYRILPVNPQITGERVHSEFVWRDLSQLGVPIDIVDIFRRPMAAGEAVDEAIAVGAKAVWLQLGVVNEEAGFYPPTATALALRDPERSRRYFAEAREAGCWSVRLTVRSLDELNGLHEAFTSQELATVQLNVMTPEAPR